MTDIPHILAIALISYVCLGCYYTVTDNPGGVSAIDNYIERYFYVAMYSLTWIFWKK